MAKHDNKKYIIVDVIYWKQKTHNFLSFSLVAEALTGLIYHRPSGENSSFVVAHLADITRRGRTLMLTLKQTDV